jgi:hypothetical protein
MMDAVRTSETSVYYKETTWRFIPEDSNFHTRRRENFKSHKPGKSLRYLTRNTSFFSYHRLFYFPFLHILAPYTTLYL